MSDERGEDGVCAKNVRVVRVGHGGNCSSVGSVIDTLFLGAAAGGAIFAAICAAMQAETITVVGETTAAPAPEPAERDER
jgi:hypothetical protein